MALLPRSGPLVEDPSVKITRGSPSATDPAELHTDVHPRGGLACSASLGRAPQARSECRVLRMMIFGCARCSGAEVPTGPALRRRARRA
jgi:hypothetical protein